MKTLPERCYRMVRIGSCKGGDNIYRCYRRARIDGLCITHARAQFARERRA